MISAYSDFCVRSGTSMDTSCAPLTASAGAMTFNPSFLAFFQLSPLRTPTTTS